MPVSHAANKQRSTQLAHAVALALAGVATGVSGTAHAQQAFSPAWFANKGAVQSTVTTTGRLPDGRPASTVTRPQQQRASEQAQRSINNLNLAARAIAAQQAAQTAARQAAQQAPSDIPDGLTAGGLQVDSNPLTAGWLNANAPVQTVVDGRTHVTIEQTGDKAILNWETFNVGRNTTLNFEQQASWTALNRVNDPQARPSQIAGQIKADGAVYIINRNGVIFTGSSQINTASLTASALNIGDDRFSGNFITTSWNAEAPTFEVDKGFVAGAVSVQAGAHIETAKNGRVVLLGGDVRNEGEIVAADGQVLLGAAQAAYLAASNDPALRGLRIELGEGGEVSNAGILSAPRGNVTLAGRDVSIGEIKVGAGRAAGVLSASTTVTANGSITLQARDRSQQDVDDNGRFLGWLASRTGSLLVGDDSSLQILPELKDTQTVSSTALLAPSTISLDGRDIRVSSGALLHAPSGDIELTAEADLEPSSLTLTDDSRIHIDDGAILDVSGTRGVALSLLRNFVQVELRGAELADTPLTYDELYGKKVWVDIRDAGRFDDALMQEVEWIDGQPGAWQGSPLFNTSGYIGLIQRGVAELTTRGGNISLSSFGDVVLRQGSQLNVSGGTIDWASAKVPISYVLDAAGRYIPVGQAQYGELYTGVAGLMSRDHARWGVRETFGSSVVGRTWRYEAGYVEGRAAGTVSLLAPRMAVDGLIVAAVEAGDWQLREGDAPVGGRLILGDSGARPTPYLYHYNYLLDQVRVQQDRAPLADSFNFADSLAEDFVTIVSANALEEGGIGALEIYANGSVAIAEDTDLDLGDKGTLVVASRAIEIDGRVRANSGELEFAANATGLLLPDSYDASIRVGASAVLDVTGHWTNAFADSAVPAPVDGGSVSLLTGEVTPRATGTQVSQGERQTIGTIQIAAGSLIDVSAGGRVDRGGELSILGDAGDIVIGASTLELSPDAQLHGYALASRTSAGDGGSLDLIGRGVQELLTPEFLQRGGFATYGFDGVDELRIESGTQIELAPQHRQIERLGGERLAREIGTAAMLDTLGELVVLPAQQRSASGLAVRAGVATYRVSGNDIAIDDMDGSLVIGEGARIDAGIGGSIFLAASDLVQIDGVLAAPAGEISAAIFAMPVTKTGGSPLEAHERQTRAIWLSDTAQLLAPGAWRPSFNEYGLRTGEVLAGGAITLDASRAGYVVTEAGSVIDVSGSLATLDLPVVGEAGFDPGRSDRVVPLHAATSVWSDGGSVDVLARDGAWLDGSYRAGVLDPRASAGSFHLLSGAQGASGSGIVVRQDSAPALPEGLTPGSSLGLQERPPGVDANVPFERLPTNRALVSAASLNDGGFGGVHLDAYSRIDFQGDVALQAREALLIDAAAVGSVSLPDSVSPPAVHLAAPYVRFGAMDPTRPKLASPAEGEASLHVAADLIEFGGYTGLDGFGLGEFISRGDLLFSGTTTTQPLIDEFGDPVMTESGTLVVGAVRVGEVKTAGDLVFGGRQLYPVSGAQFTVGSSGADATLTILPGDAKAPAPLSAGGRLTLQAPTIDHQGALRAPLGQITLDAGATGTVTLAEGSVTDVSLHARTLPYGSVFNDFWYLGVGESELGQTFGMPRKKIVLSGDRVDIATGASVDLSGGGDLLGVEFVPGTGGSRDVLLGGGVYAVLPGAQSAIAPLSTRGAGGASPGVGESVWLAGVPGLEAGYYTLLPAEYALLPGAFRVSLVETNSDRSAAAVGARPDGAWLVSGWHGSTLTETRDSRASTFLVMSGEVLRQYSEYSEVSANAHFKQVALDADTIVPPRAIDAGQMVLRANSALNLGGLFDLEAGVAGRGGLVDIASASIAVVAEGAAPVEGYALTISGNALSAMGAQSLMLGGDRQEQAEGYALNVVARDILVANDAASALTAPEVLLLTGSAQDGGGGVAGSGVITIAEGAVVRAEGEYLGAVLPMLIGNANAIEAGGTGMGSLLAVSNASDLIVRRHDIVGVGAAISGSIAVDADAILTADATILLDATADSVVAANSTVRARSLELASSTISFGDAAADVTGFIATPATLAGFSEAERLVLRSYGTIDFYDNGSFDLRNPAAGVPHAQELVLDAAALRQHGSGDIDIKAQTLTLRNTSGRLAADAEPVMPNGSLRVEAQQLIIGEGDSRILGFERAALTAQETRFVDAGGLTAGKQASVDLTLTTPFITSENAAEQLLAATGALALHAGTLSALDGREERIGTGGVLTFRGNSVDVATAIRLPAGVLTIDAQTDLTIAAGATIDVSGRDQSFFDQVRALPAGEIKLIAQTGAVLVEHGALLDLSDPKGGGKLSVTAPEGSFTINGAARGGSFVLDAGSLPSFGAMQAVLNDGGFAHSRKVRLRAGDALIDGMTRTRDFNLTVDQGGITVTGTIDASGPTGGSIRLTAADDVVLESGSRLTVAGEDFDGAGRGGSVYLSAGAHRIVDGEDVTNTSATVDIRAGSLIDLGVANAAAAAKIVSLDAVGSSVALAGAGVLTFPEGTPQGTTIRSSVAGSLTYADGTKVSIAAGEAVSVPAGATLSLSGPGEVSVVSGGHVTVALPTTGAFATSGATTVSSVPVTLNGPGSSINLAGGVPVILPNGTPGDDLITTTTDSVSITTVSDGSQVTLTAGSSSLELSAGSIVTIANAAPGVSVPIGAGTVYAPSSSGITVRLTHGASSSVTDASGGEWPITFQNVPAGATMILEAGTRNLLFFSQPGGTAGSTFVVGANNGIRVPLNGALSFPQGTAAGATLVSTASGTIRTADGSVIGQITGNQPFTVPAGASIHFAAGGTTVTVSAEAVNFPVALDFRTGSGAGEFMFSRPGPSIAIEALAVTPGSRMRASAAEVHLTNDIPVSLHLTGFAPDAFRPRGIAWEIAQAELIDLQPNAATVALSGGGTFAGAGDGALSLQLAGGGRFTTHGVDLGRLSAGTVLALEQAGRIDFASGSAGAIPVLLPASASFTSTDVSVFATGGGQAGTLHLRAPQQAFLDPALTKPIDGIIVGAANIIAEGYRVYDLSDSNGVIDQSVQNQVRADAADFATRTAAIKDRLLVNNAGLRSLLYVTPGAEVINANQDVPGTVQAVINPQGMLGLPDNTRVTLPRGLTNGVLLMPNDVVVRLDVPADGARIQLDGAGQYLNIPAGVPVEFPEGTPADTMIRVTRAARLIRPDGTSTSLSDGNSYSLEPGSVIVFNLAGSITRFAGSGTVHAVLAAGSYSLLGASPTWLPVGTTLTTNQGATVLLRNSSESLPITLPSGRSFTVNGVGFGEVQAGASVVTLAVAGTDGIALAAQTALSSIQSGQVRADAAGSVYDASGALVSTFAAGDVISIAEGDVIRLDADGTVTTMSANLQVRIAGSSYATTPNPTGDFTRITMSNAQSLSSWLEVSGGSSISVTVPPGANPAINLRSTVTGIRIYWPDGTLRLTTAQSPTQNIPVSPGERLEMPASGGRLTLVGLLRTVNAVVSNGSYVLGGRSSEETVINRTATVQVIAPSADLRLSQDWDLANDRFGPDAVPGILTLRAAGDLVLDASLSDGFAGGVAGVSLIDDRSWSYNLVGGADFAAGDLLAVRPDFQLAEGKGNVLLNPQAAGGTRVRTGTGDISVAAARNIHLQSVLAGKATSIQHGSLYTAGRPANSQPAGGAFTVLPDGRRAYGGGTFTLASGGGDISLNAQQDIVGNTRDYFRTFVPQEFSDWLLTQGETDRVTGLFSAQPGWGVSYAAFREGVATLGGGNLTATAGRDLLSINLAAANSGMFTGVSPESVSVQTHGGGDVTVSTGRDVLGSQLFVADGVGSANVGRDFGTLARTHWAEVDGEGYYYGPQPAYESRLALGDAQFELLARGDAKVGSVFNPTLTYKLTGRNGVGTFPYLSTYTDRSAVSVHSIAGEVHLTSQPELAYSGSPLSIPNAWRINQGFTHTVYPGTVEAVAFTGDIAVGASDTSSGSTSGMLMAPARDGDLSLLSQGSIEIRSRATTSVLANIAMSDAEPSVLLRPTKDLQWLASALLYPLPEYFPAYDVSRGHSASLYRAEDANPVRIYAVTGDIVGNSFSLQQVREGVPTVVMPKPATILAGRDIVDFAYMGQNFDENQTTQIRAGRDFRQRGTTIVGGYPDGMGVWVGGPGALEVTAGRNVDLYKSEGILAIGDQMNPYLPDERSADIAVIAGAGAAGPDYAAFAAAYLDPSASSGRYSHAAGLLTFMRERTGDGTLDQAQAWVLFVELPESVRNAFVREIYFKELARVGGEGVTTGNYNAGYDAVETLFPTRDDDDGALSYSGDVSLRYSQIKSLYDGDIELLVPGGGIDGGVSVVGPEIGAGSFGYVGGRRPAVKAADQLGVVALRGGDIRIMAYEDVIVNQSRIFAVGGGDLTVWSSEGDINAGKGAKTAVLAPPPRIVFDPATGGFSLEFTGAATGSGLATLITAPGQQPGDVYLMAPHGTVDAGDAGIRVSGNLIVAAQEVRGVDNIEVEGLSFGVPTNTVNVAALTDASAAASQAATTAQDVVKRERANSRDRLPSIFDVRVLGFGETTSPVKKEAARRTSYDPDSAIQVLGDGELTDSQKARLTPAELHNWERQGVR